MSTIKPLALYQIETFGAGIRDFQSRNEPGTGLVPRHGQSQDRSNREKVMNSNQAPRRATEFLVQLMVDGDSDLRKVIGRKDVAERREAAYGAALANRPSARPLSFLTVIGTI